MSSFLGSGGGDVATDKIWNAAGDIAVGTGADTATRLPVGVDGYVLTSDSREVTGFKWTPPIKQPEQNIVQGSFVQVGGGVDWSGTGYTYIVAAASYYINGVLYTSPQTSVTLSAADAVNDRIDVTVFNTSGAVDVVEGLAAANPSEPTIDPATQVYGVFIIVEANTLTPTVSSELVYAENAGSPAEWAWTTNGVGFNVNSSNNPRGGSTKCIEGTTVANNAYAQGQRGTGTLDPNAYDNLVLYIRSKATWNSNRYLLVSLLNAGVRVGNVMRIASSGTWGFASSDTTTYQAIIIPTLQFAIPSGTLVNQIRIQDSGGSIGFYIDDVSFRGDVSSEVIVSGMTQDQADARYAQRSNNLSDLTNAATARTNLGVVGQLIMTREGILAATAGTLRFYNHLGSTITIINVQADINTAPTGANVIVDVHKDGVTIFTTQANRPEIAASNNSSGAEVPDVTAWADGSYLTLDVDLIGSTIPGSNLTVTVKYTY